MPETSTALTKKIYKDFNQGDLVKFVNFIDFSPTQADYLEDKIALVLSSYADEQNRIKIFVFAPNSELVCLGFKQLTFFYSFRFEKVED